MNEIKIYKFKNSYLNHFFWQHDIFFIKEKDAKNDIAYTEIESRGKKYDVFIVDQRVKNITKDERFQKLAFNIIDNIKKPNCLYTCMRVEFNKQVTVNLSNKMNIKMKPIDKKTKTAMIIYNYFRIKKLIKEQGYNTFYEQYKLASQNDTVGQVKEHRKGSIDDYFYISTLKNIIRIYKKENEEDIDYKCPSFKDEMILKYFDNYFSKIAVIVYDEGKVKDFISNYYISEAQSEDQVIKFIDDFLQFYQIITNNEFFYENNYKFNLKDCALFNSQKAKNIKYKSFYKYFDKIVNNKNRYYNFMFMLEILDLSEYISDKKKIINYISVLELLLVNNNRNISIQLQEKCMNLLKNKKYSRDEIKLAYNYRSKIIHGEYQGAIRNLHKLSLLDEYKFSKEDLENEIYLNFEQMIEKKLCDRLYIIVKIALKYFIINHTYIAEIQANVH